MKTFTHFSPLLLLLTWLAIAPAFFSQTLAQPALQASGSTYVGGTMVFSLTGSPGGTAFYECVYWSPPINAIVLSQTPQQLTVQWTSPQSAVWVDAECIIAEYGIPAGHATLIMHNIINPPITPGPASVVGLYVDKFDSIFKNTARENALLSYAQNNGFNYLQLYDLHKIGLPNPSAVVDLGNFIHKAKTQYGITHVGASGENFEIFRDVFDVYNQQQSSASRKLDVYNLELEYWNQPSNPNAYSNYITILSQINTLAHQRGVISEAYLGWPATASQCLAIANNCDRILLHSYRPSDIDVYGYATSRLAWFGSGNKVVTIIPLFSAEPGFMGPWLQSNPLSKAYATYVSKFNAETASWKQNIVLGGHQWFAYTFMPNSGYTGGRIGQSEAWETANIFSVSPNPFNGQATIEYDLDDESKVSLEVFNMHGRKVAKLLEGVQQKTGHYSYTFESKAFSSAGMYFIKLSANGKVLTQKALQVK